MIATWNVNSLKIRLPQVIDWLKENPVDFLCLQELKQDNEFFDLAAFEEIGYTACWSGQKTYNGVATISRTAAKDVIRNNPLFEDHQQRLIAATYDSEQGPIRVINVYCPNGSAVGSDKYDYKLAWYKELTNFLKGEMEKYEHLILTGDFNIAPEDRDVHDGYKGDILISPPERAALQELLDLGLHDAFRLFEQEEKSFSWWDYRMMGFRRNAGLRIDHILITDSLKQLCEACWVDKEPRRLERPSDHAPVVADIKWNLLK